jgi:hypothetical protein
LNGREQAPNATILYVYSQDTFDAVRYAVEQNLAPVISYSFAGCEHNYTSYNMAAWRNVGATGERAGHDVGGGQRGYRRCRV